MHHPTVVVIGASSGMGLAAVRRFRERGADVWMVARDLERLRAAAADVGNERDRGRRAHARRRQHHLVSGVAAERPSPGGSVTGMVNGAINAMVRGLAQELALIRVNAVSPGWVGTPFWKRVASDEQRESLFAAMREKIPARHIATVDDVAQMIELAATNRGVSATTLYVDGGQRLV